MHGIVCLLLIIALANLCLLVCIYKHMFINRAGQVEHSVMQTMLRYPSRASPRRSFNTTGSVCCLLCRKCGFWPALQYLPSTLSLSETNRAPVKSRRVGGLLSRTPDFEGGKYAKNDRTVFVSLKICGVVLLFHHQKRMTASWVDD